MMFAVSLLSLTILANVEGTQNRCFPSFIWMKFYPITQQIVVNHLFYIYIYIKIKVMSLTLSLPNDTMQASKENITLQN